ncbi:glycosyltransferase family 92 protein RCOM_0530710-like [Rutidosis leptorrhynchoides]|uniref:glycosyltransferase family 92 protein RCOM_0530710-like n=1 Tax=Rutidosis leptorrhynchoides TaxID=125765 RepID=UPI003A9A1F16
MDSSDQQRKKRKQPNYHVKRSLLLFFAFFFFFILFHQNIRLLFGTVKLLSVPSIYLNELTRFKIEDRVVFPDHILLLLESQYHHIGITSWNKKEKGLECVYTSRNGNYTLIRDVLSANEYNDIRMLIRCPLPPLNNLSSVVTLRSRSSSVVVTDTGIGGLTNSWENLAYEAVLDGNVVVVFVKGISHRQDKESDPNRFRCHFGLSNRDNMVLTTRALTAAQEVVRCVLPSSLRTHPEKAKGICVTVSFRIPFPRRNQEHRVVVPSVAKISSGPTSEIRRAKKHQLCVCTMLWNQADSVREWITYHSWLGVEKWFIYDNNSDDEIQEVIEKLDHEGFNVTRHVWPWIKTQEAGFSHCAIRARAECNWVSFMDVDEFYYFPKGGSLTTLLSKYTSSDSSIGELRTSCRSFGPSGLTSPPKQGVTVGYTCRLQSPERHKSIIRPDALDTNLMNVVHHFHLRKGFRSKDVRQSSAVINHYKYQVWESFRAKFYRRVATYVADWQDNHNEGSRDRAPGLGTEPIEPADWRRRFCEIWDTGLRDVVLANFADISTGDLPWSRSLGHTDREQIQ